MKKFKYNQFMEDNTCTEYEEVVLKYKEGLKRIYNPVDSQYMNLETYGDLIIDFMEYHQSIYDEEYADVLVTQYSRYQGERLQMIESDNEVDSVEDKVFVVSRNCFFEVSTHHNQDREFLFPLEQEMIANTYRIATAYKQDYSKKRTM